MACRTGLLWQPVIAHLRYLDYRGHYQASIPAWRLNSLCCMRRINCSCRLPHCLGLCDLKYMRILNRPTTNAATAADLISRISGRTWGGIVFPPRDLPVGLVV